MTMKSRILARCLFALLPILPAVSFAACLKVPAPSGIVTSLYGWRFHPVLKMWRLHRGVDLRAEMSTPLVASHGGVAQVAFSPSGGNELRIIGSDGTVARYLHLTKVTIEPGASVSAGQQVALSGNTGHASAAPHLHFEVYPSGSKGDVNPEPLLCPSPSRKAGADQVNGFPILACKPQEGTSCSPSSGGSGIGTGGGTSVGGGSGSVVVGGGTGSAPPPAPKPTQFDDMSTNEIFVSEVMKRFANPNWYVQLQERTTVPLLAEYVHMRALENSIELEKRSVRTRIETLLATKLARANRREIEARLERQREAAAKAGSR